MREIYYNANITPESLNELKLLALYYDKISIVNDAIYSPKFERSKGKLQFIETEEFQFIPKSFRYDYKLLIDQNIISVTKRNEAEPDEYERRFSGKISNLLNSNYDLIFPKDPLNDDSRIFTEEVYNIVQHVLGVDGTSEGPINIEFLWWYYAFKLKWFIKLLMEGKNCLTNSENLASLFSAFISESNNLKINGSLRSIAFDALKLNLPNPDVLSFEDILELKFQLRDELSLFYQTINSIEVRNKQLFDHEIKENEYQRIFFDEIQKPIIELENKMKNLRSKTFRNFVDKMKDPKTYIPLVGTVVASVQVQYMFLASAGLATGISYLEYQEEKRNITSNGLYFLLKLKK